jgi:hypothetical protein
MDINEEYPGKQYWRIVETESGIEIVVNEEHSENRVDELL